MTFKGSIKERFKNYKYSTYELNALKTRIDTLQSRLEALNKPYTENTNHSLYKVSTLDALVVKSIDAKERLFAKMHKLEEEQEKLETMLKILNSEERTIMYYRYFLCYSWEQIAQKIYRPISSVYRIHGNALQKLEKNKNDSF